VVLAGVVGQAVRAAALGQRGGGGNGKGSEFFTREKRSHCAKFEIVSYAIEQ
jgi:hypothetical protein